MSRDAFLIPVTSPEFERTVTSPVNLTELPIHTSDLDGVDTPENVRIWGVKNSNLNKKFYDKMTEGDYLLFYHDDHYRYFGQAGYKFESNVISREYWGDISADMLYSVINFKNIDVSREALNEVCDYKANYQPQSIRRMSNKAYRSIRSEYDSIEEFVSKQSEKSES
jgi:hypothetical protein